MEADIQAHVAFFLTGRRTEGRLDPHKLSAFFQAIH